LAHGVKEKKPSVVVFYGTTYSEAWKQIAGVQFTTYEHVSATAANGTSFYIMRHPRNYNDSQLDSIGQLIAAGRGG